MTNITTQDCRSTSFRRHLEAKIKEDKKYNLSCLKDYIAATSQLEIKYN